MQAAAKAGKTGSRRSNKRQTVLWCRCGSSQVVCRGLRPAYYARDRRDRRFFGGLRSAVIARDGRHCRLCAAPCPADSALVIHSRRQRRDVGTTQLVWLLALCRACHARVHRLQLVRRVYPESFLELWREQHPAAPKQLALVFTALRLRHNPSSARSSHDGGAGRPLGADLWAGRAAPLAG